mgnify:CR=1 FL=1
MLLQVNNIDTLVNKINNLESQLRHFTEDSNPAVLPIVTAILGAVLVWFGQFIDRESKQKQDLIKELNSIFTKCDQLFLTIESLAKGLSFEKNMRNFWYYSYLTEYNPDTDDSERAKEYYNKMLLATDNANMHSIKITESLCEYYSLVSKFSLLSKRNIDKTIIRNIQRNVVFNDPPNIDSALSVEEATSIFEHNYEEFANQYMLNFAPFETLNNEIELICKESNPIIE